MSRTVDERVRDVRALARRGARRPRESSASRGADRGEHRTLARGRRAGLRLPRARRDARRSCARSSLPPGDAARVHVILSANVFVAPLRAIAIARAASARVTVRPSSRDPTLAGALVAAAGDPAVSIATDREARSRAPTDRRLWARRDDCAACGRSRAPAWSSAVTARGSGSRTSRALSSRAGAAERLAADVVPFDQRGCLSPRVAFVEGSAAPRRSVRPRARTSDSPRWAARVPRGALTPGERGEAVALARRARLRRAACGPARITSSRSPLRRCLSPFRRSGRHVLVVPVASGGEDTTRRDSSRRSRGSWSPSGAAASSPWRLLLRTPACAHLSGRCSARRSTVPSTDDHSEPASLAQASSIGAHTCSHDMSVTQPHRGPSGVALQKQPPASHMGKQTRGLATGQAVPTPVKASQRSRIARLRVARPSLGSRAVVGPAARGRPGCERHGCSQGGQRDSPSAPRARLGVDVSLSAMPIAPSSIVDEFPIILYGCRWRSSGRSRYLRKMRALFAGVVVLAMGTGACALIAGLGDYEGAAGGSDSSPSRIVKDSGVPVSTTDDSGEPPLNAEAAASEERPTATSEATRRSSSGPTPATRC